MTATNSFYSARYPSLAGRGVFISGGATGIGEALVRAFHAQGAHIGFCDIDATAGNALATQLQDDNSVLFHECDVTDVGALQAAIAATRARFGPIRVLLNNAANDRRHEMADVTSEDFDALVAVNLKHQFFAAQAVAQDMRSAGGGSIINFGSISWMIKGAGYPVYQACKAAARGLTRSLARDLGKADIRVNSIVPGWVMTERQLKLWVKPETEAQIDAAQCLPGRVMAQDIASMALFLAADDSRMCSAQDYVVDAGWT
ncbi:MULTISPECIES: SDR family oxidoreductase [unclassified Variovorax]|uniref:SDR family NAD(P)-dependent oxidoreductase n=1 Tax=unclassified Variovorax TaxID=663243 RepID=UPI000838AA85|nr:MULTISPECIES: SDR family oxidoreductase [unclassified Variovorax]PNG59294.1 D-xylose 1-dehydrogenase [Variovorax sp. B4]PNG60915.1 D-xylose 1-dehydrogenase [Variovorax sp. B2]VTV13158.1 3-alpha-(or 20-beta)-hydroxysteroid dehydrogenase [Variovorax sp. WDL1]